jgi:hypothetical protein
MERDIFIISVYSLVVEIMQIIEKSCKFRKKGFPPKLTDAEVMTIEICGEFFKLHEDTEIYNYFKRHYLHYFPNLPDRTTFVRQAANLWQVKALCQSLIVQMADQQNDQIQPIREAASAINAFQLWLNLVIVPPKRWIITASNLV